MLQLKFAEVARSILILKGRRSEFLLLLPKGPQFRPVKIMPIVNSSGEDNSRIF